MPPGEDQCDRRWQATDRTQDLSLWLEFRDGENADDLDSVFVHWPRDDDGSWQNDGPWEGPETADGLHPGVSIDEVRAVHGDDLQQDSWEVEGGLMEGYVVFDELGALIFIVGDAFDNPDPDDVVALLVAQGTSLDDVQVPPLGC